jgi:L-fucose mutarotase/ribose pyranase (RbsD/FucU family)
MMDRFEYYEFAKKAYAIVQTCTTAHWANLSLKKGAF